MLAGANAHLTVTHCLSTSPTFLVGRRVFSRGDSGGALLTNVLHQPSGDLQKAAATSIRWGSGYEARSLVLQGCALGAPVRFEGSPVRGVAVDLGSTLDRDPAMPVAYDPAEGLLVVDLTTENR